MMERYLLRYFLAVIDQGNFSKAAASCNVSQPTLSVGIAKLENTVGQPLFRRTNRRVELTESGARLAPLARRIETEFAQAEREVSEGSLPSTLRIGILTTTPIAWVDAFISKMTVEGDGERVELIDGRERDLLERLSRGRIDVALSIVRDNNNRFAQEAWLEEGYVLALARSHRLAGRSTIAAEELIGETMIARRQCEILVETSRFFTARGVRPFFPARTTDEARALAYVRSGLGITVVPQCYDDPDIAKAQLEGFSPVRQIGLIYAPHTDPLQMRVRPALRHLAASITPEATRSL
ncbi:MAG: LysR family transcriptional regulator [Sphingobium sp.]